MSKKVLNKGEWCEFYTHIKILSDGFIIKADSNLDPDYNRIYKVISVYNNNIKIGIKYEIQENKVIIRSNEGLIIGEMPSLDIKNRANIIFTKIVNGLNTFEIDEAELLAKSLNLSDFKAINSKSDITLEIDNPYLNCISKEGFSIKSKLDAESTLVNASKQTRFTFQIENLSIDKIDEINRIEGSGKIIKRVAKIAENDGLFKFNKIESEIFSKNIKKVDSLLDLILAKMLLFTYLYKCKKLKDIFELEIFISFLVEIGLDKDSAIYKVKRFLWAYALGMEPATLWNGEDFVNGGLLWVKNDGLVLCHHIFEKKELEDYLFKNTFFETPSTTRHDFGTLISEKDTLIFRLCLQIRFY